MYSLLLTDRLIIQNAAPRHANAMGRLQRRVFPTLSASELLTAEHFAKHIEIFPEGQFVILFDGVVIGSTSTFRTVYPKSRHTFLEATGNLWISSHNPEGEWLYGFDLGIDPDMQGLGLGRLLYRARSEICRKLGMAGQVIVGMPSGYGKLSSSLPFGDYYQQVIDQNVFDPTVSMQMRMGFEPQVVIPDYLEDPKGGNYGVMMTLPTEKIVAMPKMAAREIEARLVQMMGETLESRIERDRVTTTPEAPVIEPVESFRPEETSRK